MNLTTHNQPYTRNVAPSVGLLDCLNWVELQIQAAPLSEIPGAQVRGLFSDTDLTPDGGPATCNL